MFQFNMQAVEKLVADGFRQKAPGLYAPAVKEKVAALIKENEEQLKANPENYVELNIDIRDLRRQGLSLYVHGLVKKVFVHFPQYEYKVVPTPGSSVCKVEIRQKAERKEKA